MQNDSDYDQFLRNLLLKYRDGNCTPQEVRKLFQEIRETKSDPILEDELQEEFNRLFPESNLQKQHPAKVFRLYIFKKVSVAAAIIIAVAAGFYFSHNSNKNQSSVNRTTLNETIQPGRNQAILTFDNGKQIILDSLATGKIAVLSGTVVSLDNSGALTYTLNSSDKSKTASFNTVSTPTGGFFKIVLPDGSNVWLNSESELTFPSRFATNYRKVTLKGEGYFQVTKDSQRPFKVDLANKGEIRVLGTEFNVMSYSNEPDQEITLVRGSIQLTTPNHEVILKPGEQAVVAGEGIEVNRDVPIEHVTAWKNGLFDFQNDDLPHILRQIARWYNVEIIYSGSGNTGHYMGSIRKSSSIHEVLKMLGIAGDVNFSIVGKKIIVNEK